MPILSAARRLFWCLVAAGLALPAQGQRPHFPAPATLDYAPIAPPGLGGFPLPTGNAQTLGRLNARATLGRVLFYDRALSRDQSRSCGSCHRQQNAFADPRARSRGIDGHSTARNSMAITNLAARRGGFFWDQRAPGLEAMVLMPISNPIEMDLDLDDLTARVRAEPGYAGLFERAFGDARVTISRIGWALAEFVRSIASLRSKYDAGLAAAGKFDADFASFTPAENRGKRLFFGTDPQHSCATCHAQWTPNMCGCSRTIDPLLLQGDGCRNNGLDGGQHDDDPGRGGITGKAADRGRFLAPSLRNIELTGPYMHDGRFATLEEVLEFYANRIRPHPTLDPLFGGSTGDTGGGWGNPAGESTVSGAMVVGPRLGFPLSRQDRADLVAFLKTLTDWELVRDPRFADPFVRRDRG